MDESNRPTPTNVEASHISVQDVLHAIFLPERDAELYTPSIARRAASKRPQETKQEQTNLVERLSALNGPTHIVYASRFEPDQSAISNNRNALLGVGTLIALVFAYVAQSAMGNPTGRFGGFLFAIAALIWSGCLLLMGRILVRRGPHRNGAGPARTLTEPTDSGLVLRFGLGSAALLLSVSTFIGDRRQYLYSRRRGELARVHLRLDVGTLT